jgi:hypothetical protein
MELRRRNRPCRRRGGSDNGRVLAGRVFPYSQLSTDALEIRLLELLPGSLNDPIECTLSTTTLQERMSFEALSYTWGKPDGPQSPVIINGFELLVSQNLFDALIHLRNDSEHRMLWIDAICINQMDWSEKTHQVQLMARIYSGAHRVLVWLGPEENDSSFVMESLQKVSRGDIDLDHEVFRSDKLLRCLKAIMERRWWSRIWVIQEVAMAANDPLLYCGFSSVSWTSSPLGKSSKG